MAKKKIQDLSILKDLLADNVLAMALVDKAEFLEKTLQDLRVEIEKSGVITQMCQGNYSIDRANPRTTSIQCNN